MEKSYGGTSIVVQGQLGARYNFCSRDRYFELSGRLDHCDLAARSNENNRASSALGITLEPGPIFRVARSCLPKLSKVTKDIGVSLSSLIRNEKLEFRFE